MRHRALLITVSVFCFVLVIAWSAAQAQEAVVTTTQGRQLKGRLVSEDEQTVVLEISGIRTPINRQDIANLDIQPSVHEQFAIRRAQVSDDDFDGRYQVAYWGFENAAYEQALAELQSLRSLFTPETSDFDRQRVETLSALVAARLAAQAEQPVPAAPAAQPPIATQPSATQPIGYERLTAEQINLIKVYEVDLSVAPRVQVPVAAIDALFERYADDERVPRGRVAQAEFRARPGHEQLALFFDLRARELYDQIQVREDPPALADFRIAIHRNYVLNYCGSAQCHGSQPVGGLFLFRSQPNSDATVYTNFFILDRYGNQRGLMIDRTAPARSLLLQYGLPLTAAESPHPAAPGWRAQFPNTDDPRYQRYAEILGNLIVPKPDYGIMYLPPGVTGTQPDTQPATLELDFIEAAPQTTPEAPPQPAPEAPAEGTAPPAADVAPATQP
jgi:hypothetical protein